MRSEKPSCSDWPAIDEGSGLYLLFILGPTFSIILETSTQILLVGNMGLYDYRPYVKKITNNRQIIFDCDKGYRLQLGRAEGATCIGGQWSPPVLPACVRENHPAIKWLM